MATGSAAFKEKRAGDMSTAEYNQRSREAMSETDLANAKKQGKTYNEYYEDSFQDAKKQGILNSDAIKNHRAYELDAPKDVRARVDNRDVGAGRGTTKADKYARGGSVKGWGIARGARKAKIV